MRISDWSSDVCSSDLSAASASQPAARSADSDSGSTTRTVSGAGAIGIGAPSTGKAGWTVIGSEPSRQGLRRGGDSNKPLPQAEGEAPLNPEIGRAHV